MTTWWYEHDELIAQEAGDRLQPEFDPPVTPTNTDTPGEALTNIVDKVAALHDDIEAKLGHTRP